MTDTPWVKVSMRLSCKTKSTRKLVGCTCSVNKDGGMSMQGVLSLAVKQIAEFYADATDLTVEELNEGLQKASITIGNAGFNEVQAKE